ncbi:MAG: glycosyltransferase family 39 protein [Acidobacteriota bacterium]|jgi:4-amino-4-deoxy-L-arabinose transferase-like glycosyltransferase
MRRDEGRESKLSSQASVGRGGRGLESPPVAGTATTAFPTSTGRHAATPQAVTRGGGGERVSRISPRTRALAFLALLLLGFLWFGNLEYRDLVDPDEGRYAEIPREMMVSGDWVTPRLDGLKYFEKPPFQYWMTAAFYSVLGVDEWVARLWPALAGLLGLALVYVAGSRLHGRRVGALAATMLAGTMMYVVFSHALTLDMGLTLFQTLAVLAIAVAQRDDAARRERVGWMLTAWGAAAIAVLSKGLIGIVLPGATVVAYAAIHRDTSPLRRLEARWGTGVFLAIAAPWFVMVSSRNPEFPRFFFWHEHFERFLEPGGRAAPWWYFLPVLVIGALPWSGVLAWSLPRSWRAEPAARFRPSRFLALWCAIVFLFFSASGSKLAPYILPIFPVMVLLMAAQVEKLPPRRLAILLGIFALPVVLGAFLAPPIAAHRIQKGGLEAFTRLFMPWVEAASGVLGAGTLIAAVLAWRRSRVAAIVTASCAGLLAVTILMTGHQSMSPVYSAEGTFDRMEQADGGVAPDVPFFSVGMYDQTVPFELGRPVTLVAYRDELGLGLDAEPERGLASLADFRREWLELDTGYAVMTPSMYRELLGQGLPMRLLAADPQRVFVRRGPPGSGSGPRNGS